MAVSTIDRLWRYPVKSVGGEEVTELQMGPTGVVGDRAYGFVDVADGRLVSAKRARRYGRLLECRARWGSSASIEVTFPDGRAEHGVEAVSRRASEVLGREVRLVASTDEAVREFRALAAPSTFADLAPVHVVTTGMLDRLAAAYPGGVWDARRLRPNILLDGAGMTIDDLLGCDLVGADAVLHAAMPTGRCVMTTLAQGSLPHDAQILRAVASVDRREVPKLGDKPCAGVYADVAQAGVVRVGDRLDVRHVGPRRGALSAAVDGLRQRR